MEKPILLNTRAAAAYLGLSASTLESWRCLGRGPAYLKVGHGVKYRIPDLDRFLESVRVEGTAA